MRLQRRIFQIRRFIFFRRRVQPVELNRAVASEFPYESPGLAVRLQPSP
jgi:hypothetical protein